jgi:hypothetical protein
MFLSGSARPYRAETPSIDLQFFQHMCSFTIRIVIHPHKSALGEQFRDPQ